MLPLKQHISITVDKEIIEQTKKLTENCDRSLSCYINLLLRALENTKKQEICL